MRRHLFVLILSLLVAGGCGGCGGGGGGGGGGGTPADQGGDSPAGGGGGSAAGAPPDPSDVAPPVERGVATRFDAATEFLYAGDEPVQTGVEADAIESRRVAVIRGRVSAADGSPLAGVEVTVANRPELGRTQTRDEGLFDLAVNGGGRLTLRYEKQGYLRAERTVETPWQDYVWAPDVVLIEPDPQVTSIDLTSAPAMQMARGSKVQDADGARQGTLLVPQGVSATLVFPDGSAESISRMSVRITEYTVGDGGPEAMPAPLPPESGYTYAMELSVDEAVAAGAEVVEFDRPLPYYVENFLGFPVGLKVPVGSYDRDKGAWVPSEDGRVIQVLGVADGLAELDTTGDGAADNGADLGVTEPERARLAALYEPGQTLWRVSIPHFTPWDLNWPYGFPEGAEAPRLDPAAIERPGLDDPDGEGGFGSIKVQNQSFSERVALAGTPFALHYSSDRTVGYGVSRSLDIPVTSDAIPPNLKRIDLEVYVAGRKFERSLRPSPGLRHTFTWDGKDDYGRTVAGWQPVRIRVGYVYDAVYTRPADALRSFGRFGGAPIGTVKARREISLWQEMDATIGGWTARSLGLGGWSLSVQHAYDPTGRVLYLGTGEQRSAAGVGTSVIEDVSVPYLSEPMDVGPDGSLYVVQDGPVDVVRVRPDGSVEPVAGGGSACVEDVGTALEADLEDVRDLTVGSDGTLYILAYQSCETVNGERIDGNVVYRVGENGTIARWGGGGEDDSMADGVPATEVTLWAEEDIAAGPDGSVYLAEYAWDGWTGKPTVAVVRRIGPDGIITIVAGTGTYCETGVCGEGGAALESDISFPKNVEVAPDGSLYLLLWGQGDLVRRPLVAHVGNDGIIRVVAGRGTDRGEGVPFEKAELIQISSFLAAPDGSLFFGTVTGGTPGQVYAQPWHAIRRVTPDGIVRTIAGRYYQGPPVTMGGVVGGSPLQASFYAPRDLAQGPDGVLYLAWGYLHKIETPLPGPSDSNILISPEDGTELYVFDPYGRHLKTLNTLTGAALYTFTYETDGLLSAVEDGDGNVTTIERDAQGNPVAIVGPFGQRTAFTVDAGGYLSTITNPAGETTSFTYTAEGLLIRVEGPRGGAFLFDYDDNGRIVRAEDPGGGRSEYARGAVAGGYEVSSTTAMGLRSTYREEVLAGGSTRRTSALPGGAEVAVAVQADGTRTATSSDGTVVTSEQGPDPRFRMMAPVTTRMVSTTPGGRFRETATVVEAELADPDDLLSLESLSLQVTTNDRTATTVYEAATRTFTATSPEGRQILTVIDLQGRPLESRPPGVAPVRFEYDERGRLVRTIQGEGGGARTSETAYDTQGYPASVTDALGRTTRFERDAVGRVLQETTPDGRVFRYAYDAGGNLVSVAPPGRPAHTFTYTPVGQVATYTAPNLDAGTATTSYTYDADRRVTRIDRPDGKSVEYAYDESGRVETVTVARGSYAYTYDPGTGRLRAVRSPDEVEVSYEYDGVLRTSVRWTGPVAGTVALGYDDDFRPSSLTVAGGDPVGFTYDRDGLLEGAGALSVTRDAQSGLVAGTTLDSVHDTWTYNEFGEVVEHAVQHGGSILYAGRYSYDALGRIDRKEETIGGGTDTYAYTYDLAGRLTRVTKNGSLAESYTYDDNGNRTGATNASGTHTAVFDAQDRLVSKGDIAYLYTANGELAARTSEGQSTAYTYDTLGNLVEVLLPDQTRIEYLVDGSGRRVGKKVDGTLVQGFLYKDMVNPVAELDGSGTVVSRFVYATRAHVPDYMVRAGTTYRIVTDLLGSVRLVLDSETGAVAQRLDYDAFGHVLEDTNPGFQPFGFAGGLHDPQTGLVRFGARDYDAQTGRWTAKDPLRFDGGDTNLYAYLANDPVNAVDANGMGPGSTAEFLEYLEARAARGDARARRALRNILRAEQNIAESAAKTGNMWADAYGRSAWTLIALDQLVAAGSGQSLSRAGTAAYRGDWKASAYYAASAALQYASAVNVAQSGLQKGVKGVRFTMTQPGSAGLRAVQSGALKIAEETNNAGWLVNAFNNGGRVYGGGEGPLLGNSYVY